MRLGELIDLLETQPAKRVVRYSDGAKPYGFHSWRGVYAQLTLAPVDAYYRGGNADVKTCGEILAAARLADGSAFQGYKGGDYIMGRETPVWADEYGDCDYYGIVGHTVTDDALILTRGDVSSYRDW